MLRLGAWSVGRRAGAVAVCRHLSRTGGNMTVYLLLIALALALFTQGKPVNLVLNFSFDYKRPFPSHHTKSTPPLPPPWFKSHSTPPPCPLGKSLNFHFILPSKTNYLFWKYQGGRSKFGPRPIWARYVTSAIGRGHLPPSPLLCAVLWFVFSREHVHS